MYFKKMIYLDLIHKSGEEGEQPETEKLGNAGFARVSVCDGRLDLTLQLRVVQTFLPDGMKPIKVEEDDGSLYTLGEAKYQNGMLQFSMENAAGEKNGWEPEKIKEIHVELSEGYAARGRLPESAAAARTVPEPEPEELEKPAEEPALKPELKAVSEPIQKQNTEAAMQSKWETLLEQYTTVHPFQDERLYLSITPEDFLLLSETDYYLRNNRFLLHGYYNYKHILLGRIPDSTGKEEYYIGVPGLFYEQEKKMAILFGFEGFESRIARPTDGTFGYYMKRVLL